MTNAKYKRKLDDLLLTCRKNLPKVDEQLIRRAYRFWLQCPPERPSGLR